MYSMMPYRRTVRNTFARPVNDFLCSFFDVSEMFGSTGFSVDVREEENAYLLAAELPGVPKDQINLSVEENTLTISADLNEEKKEEKNGYIYSERRSGHVERHFNLEGIDAAGITAAYENGVLKVSLPKMQGEDKPEAHKIEID